VTPLTLVLAGILLLTLVLTSGAAERRALRVHRLERKIDALLSAAGVTDVFPRVSGEAHALLQQGGLKDAIREYRRQNPDVSLKDAHDVVMSVAAPDRGRRADPVRLEYKIDALLRAHGLEHAAELAVSDEARAHVAAGRLIDAVRVLRSDNPGLSLTEARSIARGMRQ
jgi:hypothetical protein